MPYRPNSFVQQEIPTRGFIEENIIADDGGKMEAIPSGNPFGRGAACPAVARPPRSAATAARAGVLRREHEQAGVEAAPELDVEQRYAGFLALGVHDRPLPQRQ